MPSETGASLVAGYHPSHSRWCEWRCVVIQTACRSRARYRQLSSDPTSGLSELRCSTSAVFASCQHSLRQWRSLRCIDQLKAQPEAVIHNRIHLSGYSGHSHEAGENLLCKVVCFRSTCWGGSIWLWRVYVKSSMRQRCQGQMDLRNLGLALFAPLSL